MVSVKPPNTTDQLYLIDLNPILLKMSKSKSKKGLSRSDCTVSAQAACAVTYLHEREKGLLPGSGCSIVSKMVVKGQCYYDRFSLLEVIT